MFTESLTYLRDSRDAFKTVFVGGILLVLGVFIVPTITVVGYLMRVLRRTGAGDDEAPTFDSVDDLVELTKEGLPGFVVAFVYGIVPAVVMGVVFGGALVSFVLGGSSGSDGLAGLGLSLGLGGLVVGSLLGVALGLLAAYVTPAAVANVADRGTIASGFAFGDLRPVLLSGAYATGWLTAFAVLVVGGVVAAMLNVVPLLGTVLGVFVQFYFLVAAYYVVGKTWARVRNVRESEEPLADERPVV
ncbi:DUF4013 domain-containing protein [Candidatus Halobonum tyrrellensis]|uniref:DUF4013 domain-containing protein n=1 Tax=Candidatus Halobonum tyrrellensis G22 TaxID=1324957 RepID=V4GYF7_9EURY|nr:DUF4013 domain-containing protein [Candidatus Halobonum tyrrellensis]ESP90221.1 hypothetical protein K933_00130 [Candidatus Halobonum tyrrellensis G22]